MLKFSVETGVILEKEYPLLTVGLFEGEESLEGVVRELDDAVGGIIQDLIRSREFRGKQDQIYLLHTLGRLRIKRILLVGLGKREKFSYEALRSASGRAVKKVRELGLKSYALLLPTGIEGLRWDLLAQSIVEGSELALYRFDRFKTVKEEGEGRVESATIFTQEEGLIPAVEEGLRIGEVVVRGVKLSRDLTNTPSSEGTPSFLAETAQEVSRRLGLTCTILDRSELERRGMGGITAVSRGSQQPPKFIIMEYNPPGMEEAQPVVLIGKAITFDSGGISIKPGQGLEEMKYDKAGGAAVIGVMQVAAELRLPIRLVGLIPATENMPSGSAYKPGDILRFYGGKTAEIVNTDAEGRLILADALGYAAKYRPQAVIDLATLTGACVIALGGVASGLMGNNPELKERVVKAAEVTGERVWELPLWREYQEFIKSEVADVKNVGGRPGGAITGAAFLSNFVEGYPWVHLDIAGTAYVQEGVPEKPYLPKGATGVGVRLLTQLLREWKKG